MIARVHLRGIVVTSVALAVALAPHGAFGASTGIAAHATPTWGTAPAGKVAGRVMAMVEHDGTLYLAGEFTAMVPPGRGSAVKRSYLAALDADSGDLTRWNPRANGRVKALALSPDGRRLFVGGDFTRIGGRSARHLAALRLRDGRLDRRFSPPRFDGPVGALAARDERLYVGGDFTWVGGSDRPGLAAVKASSGSLLDWRPPDNGGGEFFGQLGEERDEGTGLVKDVAVSGDGKTVYAAGTFLDLGGQAGLVAIDAGSGDAREWQPDLDRPVFGVAVSPDDGHALFAAAGGPGGRLYRFDPGGDDDPVWKAKVDGDAVGVAVSESTAYLLGHFDFVVAEKSDCYRRCPDGPERHHLAAFDARSGELSDWDPAADTSTGPYVAVAGRDALYVGGEFTRVNGERQPGVAVFPGRP